MAPRYPIYIPSKGRWQPGRALTARRLGRDGVPFYVVVEPQEADAYSEHIGEEHVLVLPFSNLGLGSIPARNWIREHAEAAGAARHWQLDDNIRDFRRLWQGRRIPCDAGVALRVCEDLTERYTNVGVSGLNYQMFVPADTPIPVYRNVHVYSCTLVNHAMPYRWRGRLNEDTDLCLQALANGWTTLLVNAFMADKLQTMRVGGGNTAELYGSDTTADARDTFGRYEMARALEIAWPGIVKVARRFGRYQHTVNWGAFTTELAPAIDLGALPEVDEYGLSLVAVAEPESSALRRIHDHYPEDVRFATAPDGWRALPAFLPRSSPPRLRIAVPDEATRDELIARLGVTIAKKTGPTWSAWWPPRGREDLASLRFELVPTPLASPRVIPDVTL